ncbi:MAG TPA: UDP-N-acetylmuramoyl-L-alanyl-D-glutamate--2,6-diaminopimelate ligase [Baekduia sp.]|nr:UDP-N-acetylmuramoyl-L-alanyl-D-glutamate--2,6-diaminopimelate ligase [Baekduia sp.]
MLLSELVPGGPEIDVSGLAYDDRRVTAGDAFFCVVGSHDGHDHAPGAVARGAAALVVQRALGLGVPEVVVDDARAAMAPAAAAFNGRPTRKLKLAGVTGTNGKTTTAYLLRSMLEAGGVQTALIGTVESIVGGQHKPATHTTPEAIDLQHEFARMLAVGDAAVAMEVSSHALELHRVDAIEWDVAIFTNLTQDHLDFHTTMDAYFASKRRLFEADPEHMVINTDDPWGARLAGEFPTAVTIGLQSGTLQATDLEERREATSFSAGGMRLTVPLPGRFNVLNALAAVAAARALGVADSAIVDGLFGAETAPGRFQPVDAGQDFTVVVDYAHTPDSLANVLAAARSHARGRVIVVFGAGGDRDQTKRPLMGAAAAQGADVVIVTSDNPRGEDPEAIIADVVGGAMAGSAPEEIIDRRAAIERAIAMARSDDVIVIAGKGHERGQEFADGRKLPFDDVAVAQEALRARLER